MFRILTIALLGAVVFPASDIQAREMVAGAKCADKVTASVSINIRDRAPTLKEAKAVFDKKNYTSACDG